MLWERNVVDSLKFDPHAQTQWYIVDRKHGRGLVCCKIRATSFKQLTSGAFLQVKQFTSPSFFCFHTVNAWEEKGTGNDSVDIVCEVVEMPDAKILELLRYEYIVSSEAAHTRPVGGAVDQSHPNLQLVRYRLENIPAEHQTASRCVPAPTKKIIRHALHCSVVIRSTLATWPKTKACLNQRRETCGVEEMLYT